MKASALTLVALGAIALTGCDFAGGSDYQPFPVSSVQINNLPANDAGQPWDGDGSDADVFVEIQNGAGRTIWRSEQMTPAEAAGSISVPAGAVEVASATVGVVVAVYDFDTSLTDSELMVRSTDFSIERLQASPELELATGRAGTTITVRGASAQ